MRLSLPRNNTGFHDGTPGSNATRAGGDHIPPDKRAIQIATSLAPSCEPPNQAARNSPSDVSTMVEAWQLSNGARSKTKSEWISGPGGIGALMQKAVQTNQRPATHAIRACFIIL